MLINRVNAHNVLYLLEDKGEEVRIIRGDKEITVKHPWSKINQSWFKWMEGCYIQEAFPYLTPNEREFLMTGITKEEWNLIFPDED